MLEFLGQRLLLFYRETSLSWKWWKIIFVSLWNEQIPKRKHNGNYCSDIREDIEPICKEIKALSRICHRLWNYSSYRHPDFRNIQWNSRVSFPFQFAINLVVGPIVGVFNMALCRLATSFSVAIGPFFRLFNKVTDQALAIRCSAYSCLSMTPWLRR